MNSKKFEDKIYVYILCAITIIIFLYLFFNCVSYELHHAYTADAPLYWAVARGILNGITPYSGLYENKPLGIFIIAVISFVLTDDTIVCNIVSILSLLVVAIVPSICVFYIFKKEYSDKIKNNYYFIMTLLITFLSSIILMVYCEERSGGFQVEAIGAAFSVLYIFSVILLKYAKGKKQVIRRSIFNAISIMLAVSMKEPFLVVAVIGSLLFIDDFKSFWKCIVLPGLLGGVLYILNLLILGLFKPYFNIYFMYMFSTKISGYSSIYSRAFNIKILLFDLLNFDKCCIFIVISFLLTSFLLIKYKDKLMKIYHLLRTFVALISASFCVGLGATYYNHHFIFALPIYIVFVICGALFLNSVRNKNNYVKGIVFSFVIILLMMCYSQKSREYFGDYTERYSIIKENAEYVDRLLDFYNVDRYQYIGFNGEYEFYGLTKHSPMGPAFTQFDYNFQSKDTWFAKNFINQLNESKIVIFQSITAPVLYDDIMNILDNDFTLIPPKEFEEMPSNFVHKIYYRKGYFND